MAQRTATEQHLHLGQQKIRELINNQKLASNNDLMMTQDVTSKALAAQNVMHNSTFMTQD